MVSVALHIPVEVTLTCTVEFMVVGTGEKERNVCCIQLILPVSVAVDVSALMFKECFFYCNIY